MPGRCRFRASNGPSILGLLAIALLGGPWPAGRGDEAAATDPVATYVGKVRPLLAARCQACHGGLDQQAGLRLDTAALLAKGGESGPAVVKGDPAASLLLARVADPDPATRMPPEGEGEPLTAEEIATLRAWIAAGCPAPADEQPEPDPREHWAFQPRVRPAVPALPEAAGVRNPIDAFLAEARGKAGVVPQPEAPRHVLVRRLFIDLIGLPPQPDELAAILADPAADWYERLVDRLLADPRHGERWARHWMDVWRYSEAFGLNDEHRRSHKHMWHFRDWIVESLNADLPYDEMVRQMLAADELYPADPARLRAMGFLARNWFIFNRTPWLDDTVEHVGKGMLGLTLNCAKCHAHKYDPIRQQDYYRFRAFFEPIEGRLDVIAGEPDLAKDGIPRMFDAHLDRPTHLFIRGEDTKPDTSRSIEPGVPPVIAGGELRIEPVALPPAAYEPERQPWVLEAHVAAAARAEATAAATVAKAKEKVTAAERAVAEARRAQERTEERAQVAAAPMATPAGPAAQLVPLEVSAWELLAGGWKPEPGRLVQRGEGVAWAAARLRASPPRDFDAAIRFTITSGGWRSVGIAFDATSTDPAGQPADGEILAYASGFAGGSKLQVAQAGGGGWRYPAEAAVARDVTLDRPHTLRVAVRDTLVNVWFDDEFVIAWRSPMPRREGRLQLVTYDATAAIDRATVTPLASDLVLREPGQPEGATVPSATLAKAAAASEAAGRELATAEAAHATERARAEAVEKRAQAMRSAWAAEAGPTSEATARRQEAARAAVRAEREVAVVKARQTLAEAEARLTTAKPEARDKADKERTAARKALEKAEQVAAEPSEAFTRFVGAKWTATRLKESRTDDPPVAFPATSTGRRTALARWITDPRNPLPARVAANHIWMRHLGAPLVATVFDFGRKGSGPVHPALLDWLASELVEGSSAGAAGSTAGWRMKHLHRLICTSAAYRMGSSVKGAEAALGIDPDNRLLWRQTPIRLEAQVVRDAILSLAGTLDPAMGGPPVPIAAQGTSRRRSLYFWHSEVSGNPFLATFDDAAPRECYERDRSIVPQQALALANAAVVHDAAGEIARRLAAVDDAAFIDAAFTTIVNRPPTAEERAVCEAALAKWRAATPSAGAADPARAHLVWAVFNHNDFVTLR